MQRPGKNNCRELESSLRDTRYRSGNHIWSISKIDICGPCAVFETRIRTCARHRYSTRLHRNNHVTPCPGDAAALSRQSRQAMTAKSAPPKTRPMPVKIISDAKRVDHQNRYAHTLEEIGILAGGIAHDFNNLLWTILGNTELAAAEIPAGHSARYNLEQVEDACRRAQELVMQIRRFSRGVEHQRIPVQLSAIVQQSIRDLEPSIPQHIEIHQHISSTDDTVLADVTKMNHLMMHLLANAIYAMRQTGGILEVSIVDVVLGDEEVLQHRNLVPGKHLILTVMDTGPGISPEISHRIFDPCFSTKPSGEHSGMGLAIVNSIVNSHGGTLSVQSETGKGTIFHVILPAIDAEPTTSKSSSPPVSEPKQS